MDFQLGEFVIYKQNLKNYDNNIFYGIIISLKNDKVRLLVVPDNNSNISLVDIDIKFLFKANISISGKIYMLNSLGFDFFKNNRNLLNNIKKQLIS